MTNEEIIMELADHDARIAIAEASIKKVEEAQKEINELTLSVQKIAMNTENMTTELQKQSLRLEKLEAVPSDSWSNIKRTAINAIVSTICAALAIGIVYLIMMGVSK